MVNSKHLFFFFFKLRVISYTTFQNFSKFYFLKISKTKFIFFSTNFTANRWVQYQTICLLIKDGVKHGPVSGVYLQTSYPSFKQRLAFHHLCHRNTIPDEIKKWWNTCGQRLDYGRLVTVDKLIHSRPFFNMLITWRLLGSRLPLFFYRN